MSVGETTPLAVGATPALRDPEQVSALITLQARASDVASIVVRVVLAEDNVLLREGLAKLLEGAPDLELAGTYGDYDTLLAGVAEVHPDVVVTDIRMPPGHDDEGVRAAAALRVSHPDVGVLVLSQHASPRYALALLDEGAEGRGYVLKERVSDVEQLLDAVRVVAGGGSVVDPEVVNLLVRSSHKRQSSLDLLTVREREVLDVMAQGMSNAAIARSLGLSVRAVEKHSNMIFMKLGISEEPDANRRVRAVLLYLARDAES